MTDDPPGLDDDIGDTGFDDVLAGNVYTPPEEPITAAVTPFVSVPAMEAIDLVKLAREVAMDVKELAVVLKEFNLTEAQFDQLKRYNPYFRNALETAVLEWQSIVSTKERVALAAAAILEDSLPVIGARMQNRAEGLPGVTEAAKLFARIAGVGERENGGPPPGEKFVINIDLGGDRKVTLETGEVPTVPAQPVGSRPSAALTLPSFIPGKVCDDTEAP